ncbi:UNVERIFIED_CONTAM: hypothetical protein HDU68_002076 [Siphonaria sp. JEL0065]|nr:hypothetical protein HDU68_002076 [Siphonaria sp. JEL0065]
MDIEDLCSLPHQHRPCSSLNPQSKSCINCKHSSNQQHVASLVEQTHTNHDQEFLTSSTSSLDVIIIGAGVIGCAIAREMARMKLKVCVLEKGDDVASGASKANSGIVHGGYDETHGTLKARVSGKGNRMFKTWNEQLNFGFRVTGSMVLAFGPDEEPELNRLLENGAKNGITGLRIIDRTEIMKREPFINSNVHKALLCPHSGITSPYEYTIALAENAILNGVQFHLNCEVTDIQRLAPTSELNIPHGGFLVRTSNHQEFATRIVINAAGLFSDKIAAMLGAADFSILPRKGEYIVLDKTQAKFANHVLFPVPSPVRGKGILVSQTFHGNLLLGPTSRDVREDSRTNTEILKDILGSARQSVPGFDVSKAITSYAGLRAKCSRGDFIIEEAKHCPGLVNVARIDSPRLTSSPVVAEMVCGIVKRIWKRTTGTETPVNPWFNPIRPPIIIKKGPEYKGQIDHPTIPGLNVICRCEVVSEAEIVDAIHRPLGAHSTDAVKKRTRAGMGSCQGTFCEPRVANLIARELNMKVEDVPRRGVGSSLLPHKRVTEEDAADENLDSLPVYTTNAVDSDKDLVIDYSQKLGKGSFGVVYGGTLSGNAVAIKKVLNANARMKEAKMLLSLRHPNIVTIWGLHEVENSVLIIMPLLPSNVSSRVSCDSTLSFGTRLEWLEQTAQALKYLHSCNPAVIHKDLRPENILLGAKELQARSQNVYAPPESFSPDYHGHTSFDVYSYAVTMYFVLSGVVLSHKNNYPFENASDMKRPQFGIPDYCWDLMEDCWNQVAYLRPSFLGILERFKAFPSVEARASVNLVEQFRNALPPVIQEHHSASPDILNYDFFLSFE